MSDSDAAFAVEYDECLKKLKIKLSELNLEITPDSITTVIKLAMEVVEASKLKGAAQKKLVTKIVRKVVVDAPIADEKEKLLLDMIDQGIVGNVIELVVSASKGEVDINAAVKVAAGCCASFLKRR